MVTSATAPDQEVTQGLYKASQSVSSHVKESLQKAPLPCEEHTQGFTCRVMMMFLRVLEAAAVQLASAMG